MKQRSPITSLLLSMFVPFYYLFWLHVTGKIINQKGAKAPSILLLVAPFLLLIAAILLSVAATAAGIADGLGIVAILLGILAVPFFIILPIVFDVKFSRAMEHATNGQVSAGTGFVLMFFVAPAAVYIYQDKLNTLADSTQQSPNVAANEAPQQAGSPVFASNQQPAQDPQQQNQPMPNTEQPGNQVAPQNSDNSSNPQS
jgi:hypothetical protein